MNKCFKSLSLFLFSFFFLANAALANKGDIDKSIHYSEEAYIVQAAAVFEFFDGAQYQINTQIGYVTDIVLGAGEEITYIGGGETVRWVFDVAKVGETNHVYIRPIKEGIDTNLIINTDRRTYRLLLVSTNWYNPVVSWNFPFDEQQKSLFEENLYIERNSRSYISTPDTLNFNYVCKAKNKEAKGMIPEQVFDDGQKTFIRLPNSIAQKDYPVLYITEGKNSSLVNYRVKDKYIILDRLFDSAQLVMNKQIVTIKRKKGAE